jgi:deoxyadenosine/deoxycytidine kinase
MIIHLNGFPGVGKLTIARELAALLKGHLVDNHSLINAVYAAGWAHGSPEYLDLHARITREIYADLSKHPKDAIQIFTNALTAELPEDRARVDRIRALAETRGVPFVPVTLDCELGENIRRLQFPERSLKQKLRDAKILEGDYAAYTIYQPDSPYAMRLDVTRLGAKAASERIAQHIGQIDA